MFRYLLLILFSLSLVFAQSDICLAQKKKKKKSTTETADEKPKKEKKKKIEDLVKSHTKSDGLFTFYQDSASGKIKMLIKKEQVNQEYIHFYYVENGAVEVGAFKGQFRGSRIIKINKYFNKIEFETQNTSFYFDPENPLSRAKDANVNNSILFTGEIKAGSESEGGYLIEADPLFLKEGLAIINYTQFREKPKAFKLGSLSKDKTKLLEIRNYEENSDLLVEYVYENKNIQRLTADAVADARNISIRVQHSFIQVPNNDYEPRYDDPRVGYFMTKVDDLTSTSFINYRDVIERWHLKKKEPAATMSEPVEPITWWIENTTPLEFRETIKEGVLQWNKAFEKIGFKNAMVVKVQPDDAEWDAGDIRYNVLRWTSSPNPPFGGYGPSFVNPRTGQILGADIMLEYVYHTYRVLYSNLFENDPAMNFGNHRFCHAGQHMHNNLLLGHAALLAAGASDLEMEGLKKEAMLELIMHEVGHTLGLNHNMKASQRFSPSQLSDKNFIAGKALSSSVMDYMTINLTEDPEDQGQYFSTTLGPYDMWAIEYGYHPDGSKENLNKILERSTEPELMFGNDADDMRSPGKGIDPRVNVSDLSNDQIAYSISRFKVTNKVMKSIQEKFSVDGESYAQLRINYNVLMINQKSAGNVLSRFIGGVYVDRAMAGQNDAQPPFTPVPYQKQKQAMTALEQNVFAPNSFEAPKGLYNYLAKQRRGFAFFGKNEDPHIHDQILSIQEGILDHIMHPETLKRIVDSRLYGNKYALSEVMTDLSNAIFKADAYSSVNTRRQNLQIEYTKRLIQILDEKSAFINHSKASALYELKAIRKIALGRSGNISTKAHRQYLVHLIDQALEKS